MSRAFFSHKLNVGDDSRRELHRPKSTPPHELEESVHEPDQRILLLANAGGNSAFTQRTATVEVGKHRGARLVNQNRRQIRLNKRPVRLPRRIAHLPKLGASRGNAIKEPWRIP